MEKRKKGYLLAGIGIFLVLFFTVAFGYDVGKQEDFPPSSLLTNPSSEEASTPAAEDEIIVKYKSDTSDSEQATIEKEEKVTEQKDIKEVDAKVLKATDDKTSHELITEFRRDHADEIDYVELNGKMEPLMVPNDPGYTSQWALPKISAPTGWDISQGSNSITIAVLDTGVNVDHPDLKNKIVLGYNVVDNNTDLTDLHGHGTLMMGIAGAQTNNSLGMAGVGIEPKIMMIRICNNAEGWAYWSDMAEAITYAADHGVKIVSISFGGTSLSTTVQNAVNYAYSKGVFIAASAGNSGSNTPSYPAAYNHVVAVGATDSSDVKASWSNWGSWVDVTSPGVSIYSTNKSGGYSTVSGTSPACPHVAGIGALLASQNPSLTPDQIESYIENNTDDLGTSGRDDIYGWGRINMRKALAALSPVPPPAPEYGAIAGKITSAENGSALVGASVIATKDGKTAGSVKTTADGSYQITNLTAGFYTLQASMNNFTSDTKTGVQVTAGKTTGNVNFNLNPSMEKGSISGRVYYKYDYWRWRWVKSGRFYKLTRKYYTKYYRIGRAKVMLKMVSTPRNGDWFRSNKVVKADRNGLYSFKDIPGGVYIIYSSYRAQFASVEVRLNPGENKVVNLILSKRNIPRWIKSLFVSQ